jgi:hypothetical protein
MSAIERANQDIERGDYGMARVRLASYLNAKGYDADMLNRLGEISFEMHDPSQAGRYWLASSADGEHVEQAVAAFMDRMGKDSRSAVSRLPRAVREAPTGALPPVAKDRMRRLGLDEVFAKWCPRERPVGVKSLGRIAKVTIAVVLLTLVGVLCIIFCTGLWIITQWLFG